MPLKIVLVNPLIPQNTGSTARLTAATNTELHLIEPLGFEISDRYLKRAGLDYWSEVNLTIHKSWEAFLVTAGFQARLWLFSTHASHPYTAVEYRADDWLVFGNESHGLSHEIHEQFPDRRVRIPMENPRVRSLNLSNCASIALYEAKRQVEKYLHGETRHR